MRDYKVTHFSSNKKYPQADDYKVTFTINHCKVLLRPVTEWDWPYNHPVKIIQFSLPLDIFFSGSCSKLTKIEQKTCFSYILKKLFSPFSKNHNFRWSLWYSKKGTLDEYTTESNCANKDYNGKGDLAIIVLDGFIDVKNGAKPFENHVKPACRNNYLPSGSLGSK